MRPGESPVKTSLDIGDSHGLTEEKLWPPRTIFRGSHDHIT